MLNRQIAPKLTVLDKIVYPEPSYKNINNLDFYSFHMPGSSVVQLDLVFTTGFLGQGQPLLANYSFNQILSGTEKLNSTTINESLDSLGAFTSMKVNQNHSILTIYCLEDKLKGVLKIITPVIQKVNYPENDLEVYRNELLNNYKINTTKTSYNARVATNRLLYGSETELGYCVQEEDYLSVSRGTIQEFHSQKILKGGCFVVLNSGNPELQEEISNYFDSFTTSLSPMNHNLEHNSSKNMKELVHVENAVQSAVKVSKITIGPNQSDFHKLTFVNTLLGGYFGSRLMSNIREDKGLTYGIHSALRINGDKGVFEISTEVKGDKHSLCLEEIDKEIKRLQVEQVTTKEMETVKNYTLGLITKNTSNPTSNNNRLINLKSKGLTYSHLYSYIKTINQMTPKDVLEISNTYLQLDSLYRVVATNQH